MKRRISLAGVVIVALFAGTEAMLPADPRTAITSTLIIATHYERTGQVSASTSALFQQREKDIERLITLYRYPSYRQHVWSLLELKSPWVKKSGVLFCRSFRVGTEPSSFVVVVAPQPDDIGFVPLHRGMLGEPNVELDPHNIAAFNAMVEREQAVLSTERDRLELAAVFFHLFEEAPRLATVPGAPGPVTTDRDGAFSVRLARHLSSGGDTFELLFDKAGTLATVRKRAFR
jgi:hypothetical protein